MSVPAGEGPDLALIHTVEVPPSPTTAILEPIDEAGRRQGLPGRRLHPGAWQGGTYQGKRYAIPLDVPQHLFYMNVKVMKDAGLVGAEQPKVPGSRDELFAMAKQMAKGDTFGFAIGTVNPGHTLGLPQPALAERRQRLHSDLKRAAVAEPAAIEVAEFWGSLPGSSRSRRPPMRAAATPSSPASSGCGSPAPGTSPACAEAKVEFTVAPVPRLFKQAVVWSMPAPVLFPKPKAADEARRDAAWTHIRWMTDHVAEWTLKAGQVSASRKAHTDPRIAADPVLRAARPGPELAGRPADPQVGGRREPHPPGDRERLHRTEAGRGGDGGPGPADQRAPHLSR